MGTSVEFRLLVLAQSHLKIGPLKQSSVGTLTHHYFFVFLFSIYKKTDITVLSRATDVAMLLIYNLREQMYKFLFIFRNIKSSLMFDQIF